VAEIVGVIFYRSCHNTNKTPLSQKEIPPVRSGILLLRAYVLILIRTLVMNLRININI
jgi:hypothetical protein